MLEKLRLKIGTWFGGGLRPGRRVMTHFRASLRRNADIYRRLAK
jgi:hypothetical protein